MRGERGNADGDRQAKQRRSQARRDALAPHAFRARADAALDARDERRVHFARGEKGGHGRYPRPFCIAPCIWAMFRSTSESS